jgi:alkylation response protein AidB-like acyl-CoA dehydrogenase
MNVFENLERHRKWSPDEQLILDQFQRVADTVIAPNAAHYDRTHEFPADSMQALNELGANTLFIPEAYGGATASYRLYLAVVKIIAEACASTAIVWSTSFNGLKSLIDLGSEEQRKRLLPRIAAGGLGALGITEPNAGSDATGMKTQFRPDGDDIIVTGGKTFITNGDRADLMLLFGKWSEIDDRKASISALIFEKGTPGFEVLRLEEKMGHLASTTATIAFNDCRVPRANLLGSPGDGLKILFSSLNKSRPSIAAHALGIATAAFKDMVAYMNDRTQSGRRVVDFQGNQFMLADLATDLAMAENWLDYVAGLVEEGGDDFGVEASMVKMRCSDLAMRIATDAVQMHGGYGYMRDFRVERLMRDAKVTQIWEGTNQVHRQLIGRSFARRRN